MGGSNKSETERRTFYSYDKRINISEVLLPRFLFLIMQLVRVLYKCDCPSQILARGTVFFSSIVLVEWKKISDAPVCFGARDNKYGVFTIKENGLIDTFKLVHASGSGVRCNYFTLASYWGCENRQDGRDTLLTVITFSNNTALPIASYSKEVGITGGLCSYYTYKINGTTSDSKELIFEGLHSPLWVTIGQEFRIWHGQDLTGCSEINNSGQTCADVYAWYTH